jgi:hypothetical protein
MLHCFFFFCFLIPSLASSVGKLFISHTLLLFKRKMLFVALFLIVSAAVFATVLSSLVSTNEWHLMMGLALWAW